MMLILRARIQGIVAEDLTDLMDRRGELIRTWAMRGTIHLMTWEDQSWIIPLLGPAIIAKTRRRRQELGLDERLLARCLREIRVILADGNPVTREDLIKRLIDQGVTLERKSQAPYHLLAYASLLGIICIGSDNSDGEQTFVLADQPLKNRKPLEGKQALAELAYRYLQGYGPARSSDFAWWSGLPVTTARQGWELMREKGMLAEIMVENRTLWLPETQLRSLHEQAFTKTIVNLLPAFDNLVLGYSDREHFVPEKYHKEIYHGGQTVPLVLVNGMAAGVWRYERRGKKLSINVQPFEPFDRTVKDLVEKEAEDVGRFMGISPTLTYVSR